MIVTGVVALGLPLLQATNSGASETVSDPVQVAAFHTESEHTAFVNLKLSGKALKGVTAIGTGTTNFATGAMTMTAHYEGSAKLDGLVLHELFVRNHFYMNAVQDGEGVSEILLGKSWIEEPSGATTGTGSNNPGDFLTVLAAHGSTVVDMGSFRISGVPVREYKVTPNPAYVLATIQKEHIPASLKTGAEAFLKDGPPTYTVWIDPQHLLRRLEMTTFLPQSGSTLTESVTMNFSHFGIPVSIAAPRASSVASYQQFEAAVQNPGSS